MVGQDRQRNSEVSYTEPNAEETASLMRAVAKKDRQAFERLYYIYTPIERMVAFTAANTPIPEPLEASEVGHSAAFLCSPLASGITGTTLYVDKGYRSMGMTADGLTPTG